MALIENSKTPEKSGYENILGDNSLSILITRIHSTKISSGTELEKLLFELAEYKLGEEVDDWLANNQDYMDSTGVYMVEKKTIKKSKLLGYKTEPDFLGIDFAKQILYIIEVKDGENFDTKKSAGEYNNLMDYSNFISNKIPFKSFVWICLFNTKDKEKAVKEGLKSKFEKEQVITGEEFCDIFGINFDTIIKKRKSDINQNLKFMRERLLKWLNG